MPNKFKSTTQTNIINFKRDIGGVQCVLWSVYDLGSVARSYASLRMLP